MISKYISRIVLVLLTLNASISLATPIGPTLEDAEFSAILDLVREAGFQSLIDSSKLKLNAKSDQGLKSAISISPSKDDHNPGDISLFNSSNVYSRFKRDDRFSLSSADSKLKDLLSNPEIFSYEVTEHPGYYFVNVELRPIIYLSDKLTVAEAAITLIHEMTHLKVHVYNRPTDFARFSTAEEYVNYVLNREGGEVDAYIAQLTAAYALVKKFPEVRPSFLGDFESSDGTLPSREAISDYILPLYSEYCSAEYREGVNRRVNRTIGIYNLLPKVVDQLQSKGSGTPGEIDYINEIQIHRSKLAQQIADLKNKYGQYLEVGP